MNATHTVLNVGFIPLLDCASLVVAQEKGFALAEGLELRLLRESSWANIRDRVAIGQFDAAQMLGPMVVAASLGAGHLHVPMLAPAALGLGGNAITVSRPLWESMREQGAHLGAAPAGSAAALARVIRERHRDGRAPLTFAMVFPFSCHNYELRYWLACAGIDPDADIRLVVVPPPLLVDALGSGQVDGFCVGEPWNSVAVAKGLGCIVAATTDIWERSPEKVLGMRSDWAEAHPREVGALVRAVAQAAAWCDQPENHEELARLLSEPRFVGVPATLLRPALDGRLPFLRGMPPLERPEFILFARHWATVPWPDHAAWYLSQMRLWGQLVAGPGHRELAASAFRADLYRDAVRALGPHAMPPSARPGGVGAFFDGRVFDVADIDAYIAGFRTSEAGA
jgi:ABC-type nitrate/sulfonate/bicarbonate transport system substrate-binding protein